MTPPLFELTAAARLDLLEIWNYLGESESLERADRIVLHIEQAIERVAAQPSLGHLRRDLTRRRLLFYGVHSYLIVYRPRTSPLHVLRILHASRDISGLLADN